MPERRDPSDSRREPPGEQITGLVERVTFHNAQSGFCVLKVKVRGQRDLVVVVGTLPEVREGEYLQASGRWTINRDYGRQFQAETLRTMPPNTAEGIERYLASGLIKGIGPVLAKRLVARFRERVFEIIDRDPHNLTFVEGIGRGRKDLIVAAWRQQKAVREIMVFLHSHGVSTSRAFRIYKAYGSEAIDLVSQDPYRLARDIQGIGFRTADQIARSLGIAADSDLRARAGVEYALQQLTEQGHCGFGRQELTDNTAAMLEIPLERIVSAVEFLLTEGRIVQREIDDDGGGRPAVFLAGLDQAEESLAAAILQRLGGPHPCPDIDVDKAIRWAQGKTGLQLAAQQCQAVRLACTAKVLVITGGPGVGKTTIINSIAGILGAKGLRVVLAAPTGRAAKRMSQATGMNASTIHRLLEFDPATGGFKHDAAHPLRGEVFILDETSMLDVVLAWQVVRAIPMDAALVLVGDVDQLPSVGPGCVLRDIIDSGAVPVVRLTEVFRQAARSAIVTNAHRVNQGLMPLFPRQKVASPEATDFYFIPAEEPAKAVEIIRRLICQDLPEKFGLDRLEDVQLLSPMQRGELGVRNLNAVLQQALNPAGPAVERYGWTFRAGDKVMQTVNDYDKDVFNGDIGRVVQLDEGEQELAVSFDGRRVTYDFNELDELALSYAVTIHKSQGSEFPAVVVPVHTQHYVMLQRNLLYTAITRGRKLVVLVGTEKALALAVQRTEARRRVTLLRQRLLRPRPPAMPLLDGRG